MSCDEIDNRVSIGWSGTLVLCVGVPFTCAVFATLYLKRKFKSALSYFLVRSIFSGLNDSAAGFGFKIFCMGRVFFLVYIIVSPAQIMDMSQPIGLQGLVTTTLFVEGLLRPRTTRVMNILEQALEMVLFAFLQIGFAASFAAAGSHMQATRTSVASALMPPQVRCSLVHKSCVSRRGACS
jgi:hypothetical protein